MIVLIRHARTHKVPQRPVAEWELAHGAAEECAVLAAGLRARYDLSGATWASSPESKAIATARYLTDAPVGVVEELREVRRGGWLDNYDQTVAEFFAAPSRPAGDGWETAAEARQRFDDGLRHLVGASRGGPLVVVSHGLVLSAWAFAELPPAQVMTNWQALRMPDARLMSDEAVSHWLRDGRVTLDIPEWPATGGMPAGQPEGNR